MSIDILFQKANKFFIENNHIKGLDILKDIWIQYPKNTRLIDEINRHSKKFKKSIIPTFSDQEIQFFFNMYRDGKINLVIEKQNMGKIIIVSTVSHIKNMRELARKKICGFHEVYLNCSAKKCAERDYKGFYKRARAGEIKNYTGVDSPYEVPKNPELIIDTDNQSLEESVFTIFNFLELNGIIN